MFNVAVIGLGMGQAHLQAYRDIPDVRILGIADMDEKRLGDCARKYAIENTFTDYHALLAQPDLHLVSVCLPNFLHAPVSIDALKAGKHVLVEKPMARTVAEAKSMIAAAGKQKKTLAVSMNYRWGFHPDSFYLKQLIRQGRLGDIYYVRTVSLRRRSFSRDTKTWFIDKARSGGGGLVDMGPHMLDLAMWFAGDYAPLHISGVTRNALMPYSDVDDFSTGLIRMKGGATIQLESTWATHTKPAMHITIFGTEGGAVLDPGKPQGQRLTLFGMDGETWTETVPVDIHLAEGVEPSVQAHVVARIKAGQAPENSAERGLAVMQVIEGIYRSSETGREVVI